MPDDRRLSAHARGYNHRWRKARLEFLTSHPLCRMCQEQGRLIKATVVDHIIPHKGDDELFWDEQNWQSLCKQCHDSAKQREERTGLVSGCNEDGQPVDLSHHWNK